MNKENNNINSDNNINTNSEFINLQPNNNGIQ